MKVHLAERLRQQLIGWSRAADPREACGVLVGRMIQGGVRVDAVECGENRAPTAAHDRFDLDPAAVIAATARARAQGRTVVGVWHSHPRSPASPSVADRVAAAGGWTQVIVSLAEARSALAAWRLVDGEFVEDDLAP